MDANIADKIKGFFSKKKTNKQFKNAGPGRRLTDDQPQTSKSKKPSDVYVPIKRDDLTNEAKRARDAALERMKIKEASTGPNFSLKAIREQARKELEEQSKRGVETSVQNLNIAASHESSSESFSVEGVFFRCPLISDEILPKKEWQSKIKAFLYDQLSIDPGHTACLIIKNCNVIDKAEACIETLKKYIANITSNPAEIKFHKIRMSNRIYCEKVAPIEGASEFMRAAGFQEQTCDNDQFWVWSQELPIEFLVQLCEALDLCEVIQLEIDRNIKVLLPSQAKQVSLPPDFFRITKDELLMEQKNRYVNLQLLPFSNFFTIFLILRTTAIEEAQIMKTKVNN